ncbi:serine/threonine-protein kinase ULK3 [Onthophagus taurus]|uniref:serine/threonine-protein kinase ULK3 n=1 Tax=Onthophagus taurus TaxID=166361 RepID=UPI000C2015A6|nr:serine/threonine-protein kinase ULK3-like [Onthophagus taurus]XP_022901336.1 serine/threonine-protein kinase ULK3-like [Onthophagus taurus]
MLIMETPHVDGYELGPKVGGGSFSTVYRAFPKGEQKAKDGNDEVAVKCIHRDKRAGIEIAVAEIKLMKSLNHPNIVRFYDFGGDSKYIYIIMEYCNEGDLSKLIKQRYKLVETLVQMLMQHLALAMKYLRQHNLCHMDLKPQNLLLTRNPGLALKVADFGLSRILCESNLEKSRFAGSVRYMAPEKLLNMKYDSKIDLWSVGVIMFECLVGRTPFGNLKNKEMCEFMSAQRPMPIPASVNVSPVCENLLYKLLCYNPQERIDFEAFFEHEFLNINYCPCEENFSKVRQLMMKSFEFESEGKHKEALYVCQKAICYMECFVNFEPNKVRKQLLLIKLNDYKEYEEKLRNAVANKTTMMIGANNHFNSLQMTFRGTPQVTTAVEIGMAAEMYYLEGKKEIALTKFLSALDILMPLLHTEPNGPRKEILSKQITKWLSFAENLKNGDNS